MSDDNAAAGATTAGDEPESAGFWVRGGALVIDTLVLLPAGILASLATRRLGASVFTAIWAAFLVRITYQTLTVGRWGQTVGKMAAGIRITRRDGGRVGYPRALGRAFAAYLSAILLDLGYAYAAFEPQKRALHDRLADTRVVFESGIGPGRRRAMAALGVSVTLISLAASLLLGAAGIAGYFFQRAGAAEARGDYARADDDYSLLIRAAPKYAQAWNCRCWERAIAGRLDEALQDCDQSLRLGRSAPALDSRGLVLLKLKRIDESIASYDDALALDPTLAYSLYGRGLARAENGDRAGSEADIQAALKIAPGIGDEFHKFGLEPAEHPAARF